MENEITKKSFVLYCDTYESIKNLSVEDKAILLDSIFQYSINRTFLQMSPVAEMAFGFIKTMLDRDEAKWEKIRESRREAGSRGGRKKQANVANAISASQNLANVAVNVNDSVNGNVSEINEFFGIRQDDGTTKQVLKKEIYKYAQIILNGYYTTKKTPIDSRSKLVDSWFDNFTFWVQEYSLDQIAKALTNFLKDEWGMNQSLSIFFKQTDAQGEPVDRIGDFLQK